jgi:glycosyltransferase involved in cell wall biosynthesis
MTLVKSRRVLVSSFTCKADGKSETYSGYKWLEQIARYCDTTLVTADDNAISDKWQRIQTSRKFRFKNKFIRRLNGEVHFDYFWFNYQTRCRLKRSIAEYDLVHHVVPIAPRYPNSIGCLAQKFILGPIGGGLRVPERFRREVEGNEEWFYKLRALDRTRLDYDPFLRSTYNAADLILLVGSYMFDLIPQRYHSKCRVILETGIDAHCIKYEPRATASSDVPIKLLYVGRIVPYKGLIYLLRALSQLPEEARSSFKLTVVGDGGGGGYEKQCKDFVAHKHLQRLVSFVGFKTKAEIAAFYQECDLFVFPSLAETSGNVVIEAMAMGRPVIAMNCGGPAEVVSSSGGFLLEPKNPEFFIETMKETFLVISRNRSQLAAKGIGARKIIEERFDWERKGDALQKIYDEVLQAGSEIACGPKHVI